MTSVDMLVMLCSTFVSAMMYASKETLFLLKSGGGVPITIVEGSLVPLINLLYGKSFSHRSTYSSKNCVNSFGYLMYGIP